MAQNVQGLEPAAGRRRESCEPRLYDRIERRRPRDLAPSFPDRIDEEVSKHERIPIGRLEQPLTLPGCRLSTASRATGDLDHAVGPERFQLNTRDRRDPGSVGQELGQLLVLDLCWSHRRHHAQPSRFTATSHSVDELEDRRARCLQLIEHDERIAARRPRAPFFEDWFRAGPWSVQPFRYIGSKIPTCADRVRSEPSKETALSQPGVPCDQNDACVRVFGNEGPQARRFGLAPWRWPRVQPRSTRERRLDLIARVAGSVESNKRVSCAGRAVFRIQGDHLGDPVCKSNGHVVRLTSKALGFALGLCDGRPTVDDLV